MARERLATFVQVSDLHFGIPDQTSNSAPIRSTWEMCAWFDGLLGHDFLALRHLEAFFDRLQEDEEARLIVTGDVTRSGNDGEFDVADAFLRDTHTFPNGSAVGLHDSGWTELAVPGNHDHWPGNGGIFGGPSPAVLDPFLAHGSVITIPLSRGYSITFLKIDSDADVLNVGWDRLWARGSFESQVTSLDAHLSTIPLGEKEVRVLLLHHSMSRRGFSLTANPGSRTAVARLLSRHGIALVLNGHTHVPLCSALTTKIAGVTHEALEVTCGTTTQQWIAPPDWKRELDRNERNWLMVHRFVVTDQGSEWEITPAEEMPIGFEERVNQRKTVRFYP
ncbi:MAG TPA: metallophosphoesterase [Thermoanaerobaculia bacterium]